MAKVFISYSHKDEKWKDWLQSHLSVLENQGKLVIWEDRQIGLGDDWLFEITQSLADSQIAILLISRHFLTSDFIVGKEVPVLLQRRKKEGLRVLPLIISPCAWQVVDWLTAIQGYPKDNQPLGGRKEHEIDELLAALVQKIHEELPVAERSGSANSDTPLSEEVSKEPVDTATSSRPDSAESSILGDLRASSGSVVVGQTKDGTKITINNWSVPDSVIRQHAGDLKLPAAEAEQVTRDFLQDIETYYGNMPLKGMGDNSRLRLNFPLVDLFIPLNARLTLPRADTLPDDLRIAGKGLTDEDQRHIGGKLDDLRPILDLLVTHPVLVILGDPGSGKSTVVRFMAFVLATGQGELFGLGDYLPLLLPLSAYSEALEQQPNINIRRFAVDYFCERMDAQYLDVLLENHLEQGKVLVLLDGLDEVKEISQRNVVVDRVQAFLSRYIRKGNRVVITSRIIGYQEVRPPEIENLRECTLLDFEDNEIEDFIQRWTNTIEKKAYQQPRIAAYEAEREAGELMEAIRSSPSVRKLAANPLLLTMLVIQKRQGRSLPRHRVLLYEQYIVSLLHDWLLARNIHVNAAVLPNDRALRRVLEPLAWWLQESEPGKGLVPEEGLMQWLQAHFASESDPEAQAQAFVRDVREHSGLLLDRGGRRFGFMHLTFMEYLAGVWLAKQYQREDGLAFIVDTVRRYAGESDWREVLLLAIGYMGLKQEQEIVTTQLLHQLLEKGESSGAAQAIAAAALADIGADGISPEGWQSLRQQCVEEGLRNPAVQARHRVSIGQSLAVMGDPRQELMEVDAMQFCQVPAGPFWMGKGAADKENEQVLDETPADEYELHDDYWLAKYPVTVAQFWHFVNDSQRPSDNEERLKGKSNNSVVNVAWHEAMAFCQWLTRRWQGEGWLPQDWRVTLPNEPEWEKAARGGLDVPVAPMIDAISAISFVGNRAKDCVDSKRLQKNLLSQRRYPWGDELDEDRLNYAMNIGQVSTPGAYPAGQSVYGCEDLSGNVWEWTRSKNEDYHYPKSGTEQWRQREAEDVEAGRVLRGGAFNSYLRGVRSAVRGLNHPVNRDYNIGFRVCLSPLL